MKYIDALFRDFRDAYTILKGDTTSLDANDTALVVTEQDTLQLFLPANRQLSDRALAVVEIYNALCRDRAGIIDDRGQPIQENAAYQGFTAPFTQTMKTRAGE